MNSDEPTPVDELCASLLAACHDALIAGTTATPLTGPEVPGELRVRLERDLACLQLLDQAWAQEGKQGDTPSSTDVKCGTDLKSVLPAEPLPTTIGRFRIRRELGRGGYGIVFQAYDPQLGRDIALKVPRAEAVLRPELRERFLREARAAAVLDHPNVVPVYDAGEVGPVCYIASAYCPGTTLDAWLKARTDAVPFPEAAALVATLAEAVHHAHAHRVIHRDLKPDNILLVSGSGVSGEASSGTTHHAPLTTHQPKITDFGLAKFHSLEPGVTAAQYPTQSGAIVGTPRYMAPEQAVGGSQAVGPAVDIHALGAILYEVLTGRPPFVAETVLDTLEQVRSHEPLPPSRLRPKLPRDLETICLKCLRKEPGKRYASAGALAEDLRRFLAGKPIQARPLRAWERVVKWARRRPAAAALVAVSSLASVLLVAGLVVGFLLEKKAREEIDRAYRREQQTSYLGGIGSAFHEISDRNWGRAEELLEGCPEKLRGWEWRYLKRLCRTAPVASLQVGERVNMVSGFDLAFDPASRLLAIPSSDHSIRVWDAASGRKVLTLAGHGGEVLSLALSPDGRRLASASQDRTVRVWDLTAGLEKGELPKPLFTCNHMEPVLGVAFSPDGQRFATASGGTDKPGQVMVWDAASGKLLFKPFPGQARPDPLVHLAFSPDGRRLASGSVDNNVKVWDLTTGDEVYTLSGHTDSVIHVAFTPDGRRLISAGRDREVRVWDLPAGEPGVSASGGRGLAPQWTLPDLSNSVWAMALSADGSRLAIGGPTADGNVRVYDMTSGRLLHTLRGDIRIISVAFSPDGRRLAAAGHERIVRLWDTASGQEVLSLRGHKDIIGRVLFSPDGQRLASASADGEVQIWDASPLDQTDPRIRTLGRDEGMFFGLAFSPDSRWLASASADRSIKLWDVETGEMGRVFQGHREAVTCVAFSLDGRRLLSGSMDRTAKLWDAGTGKELLGIPDFKVMVYSVAFSPGGHAFATGSHRKLQLWDTQTGHLLLDRQADPEFVSRVAFSPDGKYLATAGHGGTVTVWNVTSGEEVCFFTKHGTSVFGLAFHPQRPYLASGGYDHRVRVWDRATGDEIRTLSEPTASVTSVAFSQDGRHLAAGSRKEVIVWDVTDLNNIKKLQTFDRLPGGEGRCVAFSPDGKRLAAAGGYKGKGEIKIWDTILWDNQASGRR